MTAEENVKNNIIMVVDGNNSFSGTGFFVKKDYCVTCHHNIARLEKIRIGRNGQFYDAEWIEELSDMDKDIAILKVIDSKFEPLDCVNKALPGLDIAIRGFPQASLESLPNGKIEYASLYESTITFTWPDEPYRGKNKWNKKPRIILECYQVSQAASKGFSGAPVCYRKDWSVVGIYEGHDAHHGYIIPIETVLQIINAKANLLAPDANVPFQTSSLYKATLDLQAFKEVITSGVRSGLPHTAIELADLHDIETNLKKHAVTTTLFKEAVGLMETDEYDRAQQYFGVVADLYQHPLAYEAAGFCLMRLGRHTEALYSLEKALERGGSSRILHFIRGLVLSELGRHFEEIESYDKALKISPDDVNVLIAKANVLHLLGRFDDCVKVVDTILMIDTRNEEALRIKGIAYSAMDRVVEAIKLLDHALSLNPRSPLLWFTKANIFETNARHEEALEAYSKLVEIDASSEYAWVNKAVCLYKLKRTEEAFRAFDKAIELNPNYLPSWFNKGRTLYLLDKYDDALACVSKALSLDAKDIESLKLRGMILQRRGDLLGAIQSFDRALEMNQNNHELLALKTYAVSRLKLYKESVELCDKAISISTNFIPALLVRAYANIKLKRNSEALQDLHTAMNLDKSVAQQLSKFNLVETELESIATALIGDEISHS